MSNKLPGVSIPFISQGSREACLSTLEAGIPITIDGTRANTTMQGPVLFARTTASPYKARPFYQNSAIKDPTNTTNATADVVDADAVKYKVGDSCTFYDVSAAGLDAGARKAISAIGAAGSGGTGQTRITFTGVWDTIPSGDDLLVVADGCELSKNVVMVLEDVAFNGVNDVNATGYLEGVFNKAKIQNTTYFVEHENQKIQLINIQG